MSSARKLLFYLSVAVGHMLVSLSMGLPQYPPDKHHLILSDTRKTAVEGSLLQVNCTANVSSPLASPKWISKQEGGSQIHQTFYNNTTAMMIIPSLHRSDAGRYACVMALADGTEAYADFNLLVKRNEPNSAACSITQFKCRKTKHCIFLRYRCDGKDDCGDGSDEDCASDPCNDKFKCNNTRCVSLQALCDHVDNCGDFSDEGAFCNKPVSTTQANSEDNQFGWLKITVATCIACTVGLVIIVSFIVIMVFRVKMKRLREQRVARAMQRMFQQGESAEPTSSGHGDEGPSDQHPFLPSSPQRHFGNIIVNVNNGVQYMPGYDYSVFVDAPPPYSEVNSPESGDSPTEPPPYSTLDRSADRRQEEGNNRAESPVGQNVSQHSVQSLLRGQRGVERTGVAPRSGNSSTRPRGRVTGDHTSPGPAEDGHGTMPEQGGMNSGTLPGISINSRFLQSLLQGAGIDNSNASTLRSISENGRGASTEPLERGVVAGSEAQLHSAICAGIGSGHGPIVNIAHFNTAPHRLRHGHDSYVASHSTQTSRHKAHTGPRHANTVGRTWDRQQCRSRSLDTDSEPRDWNAGVHEEDHAGTLLGTEERGGSSQETSDQGGLLVDTPVMAGEDTPLTAAADNCIMSGTDHPEGLDTAVVTSPSTVAVGASTNDAAVCPVTSADDAVAAAEDEVNDHTDHSTVPLLAPTLDQISQDLDDSDDDDDDDDDNSDGNDNIPYNEEEDDLDMPFEDGTWQVRGLRDKGESDCSPPLPDSCPQATADDGQDRASRALVAEVSRRDQKRKPKPGHLTVQGGQILLHTEEGVLANDSAVGDRRPGPHRLPRLGGELVVRDGNIMLEMPPSSRSPARNVSTAVPRHPTRPNHPDHVQQLDQQDGAMSVGSGHAPVTTSTAAPPAAPITGISASTSSYSNPPPPLSSGSQLANPTGATDSGAQVRKPSESDNHETKGRFSGELNIKDGQLVLEAPKHTPSYQILTHLQGAYAAEQQDASQTDNSLDNCLEPVGNTRRPPGTVVSRPLPPKFNTGTDIVLPFKNQSQ